MIRNFISFILLSIIFSTPILAGNNELQQTLEQQGYARVPLYTTTQQNSLYASVSLGDRKHYAFIIDTGATSNTVDSTVIKKLSLKSVEKSVLLGGVDKIRNKARETIIPSLNFNGFVAHNEPAYQANLFFMDLDKKPISGLLGLNFLRQYKAIFVTAEPALYLQSDASKQLSEKLLNKLGYKKITLRRAPSGHQIILTKIDNFKPVSFMLDSGVPKNIIALTYAKKLALQLIKDKETSHGSGGGEVTVFTTEAKKFSIGPTTWTPPTIMVIDLTNAKIGTSIYGIIGLDWLQAHQAIIDTANNQLFVKNI